MAATENDVDLKRKASDNEDGDGDAEDDEWVGPMPSEATKVKKRKGSSLTVTYFVTLVHLRLFLNNANRANKTPANS